MWTVLGLLFLTSGLIYTFREIRVIKRANDLLIISFVRLLYACSCGYFAAMVCFLYSFYGIQLHLSSLVILNYSDSTLYNFFVFWMLSVIGYLFLSIGYRIVGNYKIVLTKKKLLKNDEMSDNLILLTAIICIVIGYVAIYIWTSDMGGVANYIKYASAIRGDYKNVFGNYHMGWRKFAKILPPSTFMTFFLLLKNKGRLMRYWIVFVISIIGTFTYLICNDGRLTTAMFFIILIIGFFRYGDRRNKNIRKQFIVFAIVLFLAFLLLANLDDISYFIRTGTFASQKSDNENNSAFMTLMSEFTYIYKSGVTAVENCFQNNRLMIVDDIVFGIKAFVPGIGFLGNATQVSLYNTILCTGDVNSLAGAIPCDIIALSLYDLRFIGPFLVPFLVGCVIKLIENHFTNKKNNPLSQTFYYGLALVFIRLVTYCEVYDFLNSIFPYILMLIVSFMVKLMGNILSRRSSV